MATVAMALLSLGVADAKPAQLPSETQILRVGQLFSLVIQPVHQPSTPDRDVPAIAARDLPPSAVLLKNLNGSRTLMWIPEQHDIGQRVITLRYIDRSEPAQVREKELLLKIANLEDYSRLRQEQITKDFEASAAAANIPAQAQQDAIIEQTSQALIAPEAAGSEVEGPEVAGTEVVSAEVAGTEVVSPEVAGTEVTGPEVTGSEIAGPEGAIPVESLASLETGDAPEIRPPAEASPIINNGSPGNPGFKPIEVATLFSIIQGRQFEASILVNMDSIGNTVLRAMNLPKGATLNKLDEGEYTFEWQPDLQNIGSTALILQLLDEQSKIISSRRVRIEVTKSKDS